MIQDEAGRNLDSEESPHTGFLASIGWPLSSMGVPLVDPRAFADGQQRLPTPYKQPFLIKTYKGKQAQALAAFQADASVMSDQSYFPTSQSWAEGSYGCGNFVWALIACILLIGILIFIYMLIVKPDGTLSVTYELRDSSTRSELAGAVQEKTCPKCAESVKAAATTCRFCNHEFSVP